MEQHYIDYISVNKSDNELNKEDIKDLFSSSIDIVNPILDNIYWLDAICSFLNLSNKVSQTKIAKMIGMSQLGVSKRMRASIKKMKQYLMKPEVDSMIIKADLETIIPIDKMEVFLMYYNIGSFSMVSKIINHKNGSVRNNIVIIMVMFDNILSSTNNQEFLSSLDYSFVAYHKEAMLTNRNHTIEVKNTVKRYYDYINIIMKSTNYSTYQCKLYDKERIC